MLIDDSGTICGLADADGDQLKIKARLRNNIQPSCLGLFDLVLEMAEGKTGSNLIVASGSEKPYYLRKQGMGPRGCFLRVECRRAHGATANRAALAAYPRLHWSH